VLQKFQGWKLKPTALKKHSDQPGQLKQVKQRYDVVMVEKEELHAVLCSEVQRLQLPRWSALTQLDKKAAQQLQQPS